MSDHASREAINQAVRYVRARASRPARIAIVLGSGLNVLAERATDTVEIPYQHIPHFPRSTVRGHAGRLVVGELAGVDVYIMQGRVHYYEGYSAAEVAFPIRVLGRLGADVLLVTNAAGGLNPDWSPGDLMAIRDQINFVGMAGQHPLRGPNDESLGPRFPSMVRAYDPDLVSLLRTVAQRLGTPLREGVYAMVSGPTFETPAEVRMLRALGADAVGMSTAPEVSVARHGGMRVMGVSIITNIAVDSQESTQEPTHNEVMDAGRRAVPALAALIEGILPHLAST